jgi:hypothetical protein
VRSFYRYEVEIRIEFAAGSLLIRAVLHRVELAVHSSRLRSLASLIIGKRERIKRASGVDIKDALEMVFRTRRRAISRNRIERLGGVAGGISERDGRREIVR